MATLNRVDFPSRLSLRAIGAGMVVAVASMTLLMLVASGFGLWHFNLSDFSTVSAGFWTWTLIAEIISMFIAGWTAAYIARPSTTGDGVLHGFVTWSSASTVSFMVKTLVLGPSFIAAFMTTASIGLLWAVIIGAVLALAASLFGGYFGARAEVRVEQRENRELTSRRLEHALQ